jgi:uncharacterized protein (TIGR00369 family)
LNPGDAALVAAPEAPDAATRERLVTWQDPVATAAAGAELSGIEYLRKIVAGELPPPPIGVLMRMRPVELDDAGRAVFEGAPAEEHYNPIGLVHGGYAATLLDSVMGCAVHATLPAGVGYTTLTLELKYVRPITRENGRVLAEGEVVHRGRRQATTQGRLIDADTEKLLAHATGTCLIFSP